MTGLHRRGPAARTLALCLALSASQAPAQTPTPTPTPTPAPTSPSEKPAKPGIEAESHPGHFFVPGHYEPTDGRVVRPIDPPDAKGLTWRAGYWAREQPGWIWQPSGWQKTEAGWSFTPGKWVRVPNQPTAAQLRTNLERMRQANPMLLNMPQYNSAINNAGNPNANAAGNQITGHSYFNYSPGSNYASYVNTPGSTQSFFNYSPGSNYSSYASTPGVIPTQSSFNYSPGSVYPSYVPSGATGAYGTPPAGSLGGPPGGNP